MQITELLEVIAKDATCKLVPPDGIPTVGHGLVLPKDVAEFYAAGAGAELFHKEDFAFTIVGPKEFAPANPLLLGKFYVDHKQEYDADRSSAWYLIARGKDPNQAITIDLSEQRNGYCYDSFWDVYATGNSMIVARSFTELIERLYLAHGTELYWERENFDLGRAYQ